MKKIILVLVVTLRVVEASFSQVKVINATSQKTFGGMGGITMGYTIEFTSKTSSPIEIDSVKSIAGRSKLNFNFQKNEKSIYNIRFTIALKGPERCRTCPDMEGKQIDMRKGVVIYYKKEGKRSSCKVKKFKELTDIMAP